MKSLIAAFLLALGIAAPAFAQHEFDHQAQEFKRHALTVDMIRKYKAAGRELEKSIRKKDGGVENDEMTVDEFVKELDATPGVASILARHGMTSRSYALTTMSLLHAGVYLSVEPTMDKKKAERLLASYPAETRANIELLRKNPQLLK